MNMVQTIGYKISGAMTNDSGDRDSLESSGIMLSSVSENSDAQRPVGRHKHRSVYPYHEQGSWKDKNVRLPPLPEPPIPNDEINSSKLTGDMKCSYRLPSSTLSSPKLPTLPVGVPPTVGKYRNRAHIIPVLNLPDHVTPERLSPLPANSLLREQFIRQKNNPTPDFSDEEIRKICEQYSIMRFLQSREERAEIDVTPVSQNSVKLRKSLPSLAHTYHRSLAAIPEDKKQRITWIPRLKAWIPTQQRPIQYIQLSGGANVTEKCHPICSKHHDFFHNNLNWEIINGKPSLCPRYTTHHQRKNSKTKLKQIKNVNTKNRKPLTVPRDPFKSRLDRIIKRPWEKVVKPRQDPLPQPIKEPVTLVLPDDNEDRSKYHWMVDNSTMTEDTLSDVFSVSISIPLPMASRPSTPSYTSVSSQAAFPVRRTDVIKVDKGCDVMSYTPSSSRTQSVITEVSTHIDVCEETPEISTTPIIPKTDEAEDVSIPCNGPPKLLLPEAPTKVQTDTVLSDVESEPPKVSTKNDIDNTSTVFTVTVEGDNNADDDISTAFSGYTSDSYVAIIGSDSGESRKTSVGSTSTIKKQKAVRKNAKPPPLRILSPVVVPTSVNDIGISTDTESISTTVKVDTPTSIPPPVFKGRTSSCTSNRSHRSALSLNTPSPTPSQKSARRRGQIKRDMELTEEQKRARKAEERRKRANERYEKMKSSRVIPPPPANVSPMDINDADEFLAKFCIINPQKMEKYQRAFTRVDADKDGYLTIEEAMEAAKRSVPTGALGETDSQYLTMLLDLLNLNTYWMNVDFRIFAIIVSLAQKIAALDDYMRGIIDRFDFKSLDTKMWRARELFRQFIDNVENETMSMESLWTELKAGGVSYHHEMQVRKSLQHLKSLDVLDFLTYLPLFALTHTQIITNPLCDERII
uniref:uncharacterized protein LOC100182549 isoform X3 n=1 Tax=Ciona intestinalis TaxID=7719 RepID=UPI000EF4FE8B|nr:uncharacterized protein LOC100182549 isoform X3 [Ciona intestinalis]|eukprot:XP_026689952.1 uncharacterized protein LOC100182549 isoform X3 [Ciona intestinalis]